MSIVRSGSGDRGVWEISAIYNKQRFTSPPPHPPRSPTGGGHIVLRGSGEVYVSTTRPEGSRGTDAVPTKWWSLDPIASKRPADWPDRAISGHTSCRSRGPKRHIASHRAQHATSLSLQDSRPPATRDATHGKRVGEQFTPQSPGETSLG